MSQGTFLALERLGCLRAYGYHNVDMLEKYGMVVCKPILSAIGLEW